MAKRPTNAELTAQLAAARAELAQYATPTAVAEVVAKPETASDRLKAHVESAGHAFAKGGRTQWTLADLKAITEVLSTGQPTILSVTGKHAGRGVTGVAVGVGDDGKSVITQNVYTPGV